VVSFLPVIAAPAAADIIDIFFEGTGIPVVMGILGLVTLWAGIASWRRNARAGLHGKDAAAGPVGALDDEIAPGTPRLAEPPAVGEKPHRRRRRRQPTKDGG